MQGFKSLHTKKLLLLIAQRIVQHILYNCNRYSYFRYSANTSMNLFPEKIMLMQDYNFVKFCFMMTSSIIEGLQIHSDATGIRTLNLLHAKQALSITDCATAMGICRFCFT